MSIVSDDELDPPLPQDLCAQDFMEHKGLGYVDPDEVEVVRPGREWIYYYDLPDGSALDLRVSWLAAQQEWDVYVLDFRKPPGQP